MSTTTVIRPDSAISNAYTTIGGGSGSYWQATNDNSDATYAALQNNGGSQGTNSSSFRVGFGTNTTPAGAIIVSVTPRFRINLNGTSAPSNFLRAVLRTTGGASFGVEAVPGYYLASSGWGTLTGTRRTAQPDGSAWTQAAIDNLDLEFIRLSGDGVTLAGVGTDTLVSEMYLDIEYNYAPVPTGTGPNGNSSVTRPTFTWTYSDTDGDPQYQFRVKVFDVTSSGPPSDPLNATTALAADSAWTTSNTTSWVCNTDLTNGITYRAYIFVNDGYQNSAYSISGPYAYTTIVISPPAVPAMTVTQDNTNKYNQIALTGRENMLGEDAANFEIGTGGWTANNGATTIGRSTAQAMNGTYSLTLTAASSGQLSALGPYPNVSGTFLDSYVIGGRQYSAAVWGRSATTNNVTRLKMLFYDISNTLVGTSTSYDMTTLTTRFCPIVVTAIAPASANTVRLVIEVDGASSGNVFYFDQVMNVPYAINLLDNPLMYDLDSNGIADQWSLYNLGGGIASYDAVTTANNVYAGVNAQRIVWTSAGTYYGLTQQQDYLKAGQAYTLSAWVKLNTTATVNLYAAIGTNPQSNTSVTGGVWTRITLTFTPSSDVTTAFNYFIRADGAAANTLIINHVQLELGSTANLEASNPHAWSRGGLLTPARFEVQRSYDQVTWATIPRLFYGGFSASEGDYQNINYDDRGQSLVVRDYEARLGVPVYYRVRSVATIGTSKIASQWSFWASAAALTLETMRWWVKVPEQPLLNASFAMKGELNDGGGWKRKRPESAAFFNPITRTKKVKVSDTIKGYEFALTASCISAAEVTAWKNIRNSQRTMLIQSPDAKQWYVGMETDPEFSEIVTDPNVPYQEITAGYIEVDAP